MDLLDHFAVPAPRVVERVAVDLRDGGDIRHGEMLAPQSTMMPSMSLAGIGVGGQSGPDQFTPRNSTDSPLATIRFPVVDGRGSKRCLIW